MGSNGTCTCQERPTAFADGNVEGLAAHLAKKYGGEHPFGECMAADELASYDEDVRKQICGRVKALAGPSDKATMAERLDFYVKEEDGGFCVYSQDGKKVGKYKTKAEALAADKQGGKANSLERLSMMAEPALATDGGQHDGTMSIEVFATGEWAGLPWVQKDLDQMVTNFGVLFPKGIKPPVKVGHGDKQILAQSHDGKPDGQPALGWVKALERRGDKLVAQVANVPKVLREAIDKGLYSRVSAEIYPKFESTGAEQNLKTGVTGKVVSAVSILGAQVPEVKTLEDLGKLLAVESRPLKFVEAPCPPGAIACASPVVRPAVPPTVLNAGSLERHALSQTEYPPKVQSNTRASARHSSETTKMSETNVDVQQPAVVTAPPAVVVAAPATPATPAAAVSEPSISVADFNALKAELAALKTENKGMADKVALAENERAAARAYALNQEARRFVDERTRKENRRITQAQAPYVIRLYESLGSEDALITAEEGAELKLFAEGKEKPRALTARDCLTRLIDTWPNMKALATEMSEATEQRPETFEEAFTRVIVREKLDARTLSYPERQRVARLVLQENPSLKPTYGNDGQSH